MSLLPDLNGCYQHRPYARRRADRPGYGTSSDNVTRTAWVKLPVFFRYSFLASGGDSFALCPASAGTQPTREGLTRLSAKAPVLPGDGIRYQALVAAVSAPGGGTRRWRRPAGTVHGERPAANPEG